MSECGKRVCEKCNVVLDECPCPGEKPTFKLGTCDQCKEFKTIIKGIIAISLLMLTGCTNREVRNYGHYGTDYIAVEPK